MGGHGSLPAHIHSHWPKPEVPHWIRIRNCLQTQLFKSEGSEFQATAQRVENNQNTLGIPWRMPSLGSCPPTPFNFITWHDTHICGVWSHVLCFLRMPHGLAFGFTGLRGNTLSLTSSCPLLTLCHRQVINFCSGNTFFSQLSVFLWCISWRALIRGCWSEGLTIPD